MFKLSPKFIEKHKDDKPGWGFGELSHFTFKRTYSRSVCVECNVVDPHFNAPHDEENPPCRSCKKVAETRKETWAETCRRVTEGVFGIQEKHCRQNRLPWRAHKAQKRAQRFYLSLYQLMWTPPGRGLWIMGTPVVEKLGSASLNNCGFCSTANIDTVDFAEPFAWAMDMLMLGVGIGFDVRGADKFLVREPKGDSFTYVIPDSREGWVESVRLLLRAYAGGSLPTFDYSLIRPEGSPIRGFGGKASGPGPLRDLHRKIAALLNSRVGKLLRDTDIVEIFNFIGVCVVAGNVRRSAELALGSVDSQQFIDHKNPELWPEEMNAHRWASNNSCGLLNRDPIKPLMDPIGRSAEPGLVMLENLGHYGRFKDGYIPISDDRFDYGNGVNPCAEQILESWELCTLVETFPARHNTPDDYFETLSNAYLYAKTVTLVPTHDEKTNAVMMRNRRIGCSMSGIQQAIKKFGMAPFLNDYCDSGYEFIRGLDRKYSRWLGVPRSIRMTTVKPSGTVSILAGATPGVHYTHSEHYMRAIRFAANAGFTRMFYEANYPIEVSISDNKRFWSTYRPFFEPDLRGGELEIFDRLAEVNAFGSSTIIKLTRDGLEFHLLEDVWCLKTNHMDSFISLLEGSGITLVAYFAVRENNFTKSKFDTNVYEQLGIVRELQHYWSDNSVSCTVTFTQEEFDRGDLESAIELTRPYIKTLSFMKLSKHGYQQPPYAECTKEEYDAYVSTVDKLDLDGLSSDVKAVGERYCTNDTCD